MLTLRGQELDPIPTADMSEQEFRPGSLTSGSTLLTMTLPIIPKLGITLLQALFFIEKVLIDITDSHTYLNNFELNNFIHKVLNLFLKDIP